MAEEQNEVVEEAEDIFSQESEEVEEQHDEVEQEPESDPEQEAKPEHDEKSGLIAGIKAEREKRQALERRIAELEAAKGSVQQEPPVDPNEEFWSNPAGYLSKRDFNIRLSTSRDEAIERFPDYEEREAEFAEMAKANPLLAQQMIAAPRPAVFAYKTAKAAADLKAAGSVADMEKRITEKLEAKYQKEINDLKRKAGLPVSLAKAGGSSARQAADRGVPLAEDIWGE